MKERTLRSSPSTGLTGLRLATAARCVPIRATEFGERLICGEIQQTLLRPDGSEREPRGKSPTFWLLPDGA